MMPIKNYTTTVDSTKTVGQISQLLARFKARRIQQEFDLEGELVALCFSIDVEGQEVGYRLPARPEGVLASLKSNAQPRFQTLKHAKRVAWRILKDWIDSQLAIVEAGVASTQEVFLPYQLAGDETLYEHLERLGGVGALSNGQLLLTEGS